MFGRWTEQRVYFVTRLKRNATYRVIERRQAPKHLGILCDQVIQLTGPAAQRDCPQPLRRIKYRDPETGDVLVFLTNHHTCPKSDSAPLRDIVARDGTPGIPGQNGDLQAFPSWTAEKGAWIQPSGGTRPKPLRRAFLDRVAPGCRRSWTAVTNHLDFGPTTIARIYKDRWQIELFFKALKQNLKIKTFVGTSANALRIQIWTALIAILLLEYLQLRSRLNWTLSNLVAFLRWNLFTYRELWTWLDDPFHTPPLGPAVRQLALALPVLGQQQGGPRE